MLVTGFQHPLTREDLWSLNPEDKCHVVYPAFEKCWQREMTKYNRYVSSYCGHRTRSTYSLKSKNIYFEIIVKLPEKAKTVNSTDIEQYYT